MVKKPGFLDGSRVFMVLAAILMATFLVGTILVLLMILTPQDRSYEMIAHPLPTGNIGTEIRFYQWKTEQAEITGDGNIGTLNSPYLIQPGQSVEVTLTASLGSK